MVCDHVQIIDKGKLVFNGSIDILKQQRHGNKLLLGLNNPPIKEELLKVKGVESVELLDNGLLRLSHAPGDAPTDAIVQTAVKKGWGLHQINPDQTSLEDVFVQLTYQDAVA
jgi:ABC-2 type transport system ATP-binding protein